MGTFLTIGTALGAVIGLLHARHLFRQRLSDDESRPGSAAWYAVWALALWTLFGAYVLAFWIIGAVGLAIARARGNRRKNR